MRGLEEKIRDLVKRLDVERRLGDKRAEQFYGLPGSAAYDPPSLATGAEASPSNLTVTGAALGDFVMVSFSNNLGGVKLVAHVAAADTVRCIFSNHSGGTIDLASGTLSVRVIKK